MLEKVSKASGKWAGLTNNLYCKPVYYTCYEPSLFIVCLLGANFSFHKEKAKAIPEQGEIVSQCVCVLVCVCIVCVY